MIWVGTSDPTFDGFLHWVERKITEFNIFFPAIFVTVVHVEREAMVNEALQDLESRANRFDAYVMPTMNAHGATSILADHLMDLSTFTVDNVNDIAWQTIGRYFRAHFSLYQGKVLTLPLAGTFFAPLLP